MGMFGGEFERQVDKAAMMATFVAALVQSALQTPMPHLLVVTLNQLRDFLEGATYGGPPAVFPEGSDQCQSD